MKFSIRQLISDCESEEGDMIVYTGSTERLKKIFFEELMKEAARFNKENPGYEMKYMPGVLGVNGRKIYFEVFDTPKRDGVKNEASIYKYIICW